MKAGQMYSKPTLFFIRYSWLSFKLLWRLLKWVFGWRMIRRYLYVLACLVVLVALSYIEEDWRGKHAWEKFKSKWESKGEHFDFASIIPPPVPDDRNFALTPVVASCYSHVLDKNGHRIKPENTNVVNRLQMSLYRNFTPEWSADHNNDRFNYPTNFGSWQKAKLSDLNGWQHYYRTPLGTNSANEFPISPHPQMPAADVALALSKYASVIEELRQASLLPDSRFPLNYSVENPVAEMIFPHWESLKSCAQVLQLRAIAELELGQTEKALDDIKLMLRLAGSIRAEPSRFSSSVRMAIINLTIQPVWEGLMEHKWSDVELAALDYEMARLDVLADYCHAVRGERAMELKTIEYLYDNRFTNSIVDLNNDPIFWPTLIYRLSPHGWFIINELGIARICQRSLPTADEIGRRVLSPSLVKRSAIANEREVCGRFLPRHFFIEMLWPSWGGEAKKYAFAQASVDMARIACALERWRLAHGEYPETLDALAPRFIEKLPNDIINGQPLHYRRTDDGQFVLYSVGWNETDDGGVVGLNGDHKTPNINIGDWIWCYKKR